MAMAESLLEMGCSLRVSSLMALLRLVMDYWCVLMGHTIEEHSTTTPSREKEGSIISRLGWCIRDSGRKISLMAMERKSTPMEAGIRVNSLRERNMGREPLPGETTIKSMRVNSRKGICTGRENSTFTTKKVYFQVLSGWVRRRRASSPLNMDNTMVTSRMD